MRFLACVIGAVVLTSVVVQAQWPTHKTQGVPRTSSGNQSCGSGAQSRTASPTCPGCGRTRPRPRSIRASPGLVVPRPFGHAASRPAKPGRGAWRRRRPGPAVLRHRRHARRPSVSALGVGAQEAAHGRQHEDNPDAHCLPMGNMQFHTHPQPRKIIQAPKVIVILYEGNAGIRQIFLDGRPLPNNDPQPWCTATRRASGKGNTLVVETSGFRGGWLDVAGSPLTAQATMTERFAVRISARSKSR